MTDDPDSDPSRIEHDGGLIRAEWNRTERPSVAVVEAMAAATGREPAEMPSLHRAVDPDALDALLGVAGPGGGRSVDTSFTYDGFVVSIGSGGELTIRAVDPVVEPPPTDPETRADLHVMMEDLLRAASRNGVPVVGGYWVRNGPEVSDWDVHITRVERPGDDDR